MAAIAYVTDEKMIEYHRFKGSQSIVFWRLSEKKFSDFKCGDLLFFLSKDMETKQTKEKGLMGYGCLKSSQSMSIDYLWKKYGDSTGYSKKEELLDSIKRSLKGKPLPKRINCLLLENVFFFQNPIYLSKLGFEIKNNLESFTYLDKKEGKLTLEILNQVKETGLDYWSSAINQQQNEVFEKQLLQYQISTLLDNLKIDHYVESKYQDKINCYFHDETFSWVNQKKFCFLKDKTLYIICQAKHYNDYKLYYSLIGEMIVLKKELKKINEELEITIITNMKLVKDHQDTLKEIGVGYCQYEVL